MSSCRSIADPPVLELFPQIKLLHIAAVTASGALFAVRGLALLLGATWPSTKPLKHLSRSIDTVLLLAAVALAAMLHQYPFVQAWLTVKVVLLIVYIALGTLAFDLRRPRSTRLPLWLAALAVYGYIVSVAIAHHPLGFFAR